MLLLLHGFYSLIRAIRLIRGFSLLCLSPISWLPSETPVAEFPCQQSFLCHFVFFVARNFLNARFLRALSLSA